jgi:hypothetical protein
MEKRAKEKWLLSAEGECLWVVNPIFFQDHPSFLLCVCVCVCVFEYLCERE